MSPNTILLLFTPSWKGWKCHCGRPYLQSENWMKQINNLIVKHLTALHWRVTDARRALNIINCQVGIYEQVFSLAPNLSCCMAPVCSVFMGFSLRMIRLNPSLGICWCDWEYKCKVNLPPRVPDRTWTNGGGLLMCRFINPAQWG